jgi:SAM-dependent methyltransferase
VNTFVCTTREESGKFRAVVDAFPDIWRGRVLDAGCRSGLLKTALEGHRGFDVRYTGVDLQLPAQVVADLNQTFPFVDRAFDIAVALDVLEHTDDLHAAFDELCRVTKKYVVLTLPNGYELKGRLKFLFGLPLSGKYGLPIEATGDRHRWLFSFTEAREFVRVRGARHGFSIKKEGCLLGPQRAPFRTCLAIPGLADLISPWYLALLGRNDAR